MKNIIVGTAGHVDHGKTCLIKALTGIDCDRLKEEKKRGITIENGFADMVKGDYNISIIDVPGHEKFIRNMLIGIGGIDMVLLVIGLDEGVMPQTVEHLRILDMLDIRRGIIVYTKQDMADDPDWKELVKEDIRDLVKGTFLEGAPEIEVSAFTGYNIEELKDLIIRTIDDSLLKNSSGIFFRLPVDRVFTVEGFGTVVTGTLMEGSVSQGDEVMVYPDEKSYKVRNVQVHNETVDTALAGQRTALNLQGIKKEELERGKVLARAGSLIPSRFLDVRLELFGDTSRTVLNSSRVHFFSGSTVGVAKVVFFDREALEKGDSCYCQLKLEEKAALRRNDRFIIRFFSPMDTIGGGKILDATPPKHKKSEKDVLYNLKIKDCGSPGEIAELIIKESTREPLDVKSISLRLNIPEDVIEKATEELSDEKKIYRARDIFLHESIIGKAKAFTEEELSSYHRENRMSPGLFKAEYRSRLGVKLGTEDRRLLDDIVQILISDGVIDDRDNKISLKGFKVEMSPAEIRMKERILKIYADKAYEMPSLEELLSTEKDRKNAAHLIETMADEGDLVRLDHQYYMDRDHFDKAMDGIRDFIANNGRITLAEFRDLLGTSRKYAMMILDYTDQNRITKKIDDYRILF